MKLIIDGDKTYIDLAQRIIESVKSTDFGDSITSKTVFQSLCNYLNSGESLTDNEVNGLVRYLGGGKVAEIAEVEDAFVSAVMNDSSIENLFERLNASDTETEEQSKIILWA